jgi:hypothetical protein
LAAIDGRQRWRDEANASPPASGAAVFAQGAVDAYGAPRDFMHPLKSARCTPGEMIPV